MPEYTKLKNAELETLLKDRGLPHSGKKAELVARLQEDDKNKSEDPATAQASSTKPSATEDEIDWDDDAAPASTETKIVEPITEQSAPTTTEPVATGEPQDAAQTTEPVETEKTPVDFSIGLEAISLDEEIEKRKARAAKFGIQETDPLADEALKKLERAKKFGEQAGPRGLNEALPDTRHKRGREGQDDRGDFKRRDVRGGRGGRRFNNDDRRKPQSSKPNTNQSNGTGAPSWMTQADRDAAAARKAKFAS